MKRKPKGEPILFYDYLDEKGNKLFWVGRHSPKAFSQGMWDSEGKRIKGRKGIPDVPYNSPEIAEKPDKTIFICCGEKDADRLKGQGLLATTNPGGEARKWNPDLNQYFEGRKVIILPDNDEIGKRHGQQVARSLFPDVDSVRIVELPGLLEKGDVSDFFEAGNSRDGLLTLCTKAKAWEPGARGFTGKDLDEMKIKPPKYAVPGMLVDGLSILAGKPKQGKSLFAENLALAISTTGVFLNKIEVDKGPVIYLSLEDTPRRLQDRQRKMLQGVPPPDNLHYFTDFPRTDDGGLPELDLLAEAKKPRTIIIDTLARIRPLRSKPGNPYDVDYNDLARIKALADKYSISILLIHHLRKAKSEDIFDTVSGTLGLTGAADTVLILQKKQGERLQGSLHVTGRDMDDKALALSLNDQTLTWELLGELADEQSTENLRQLHRALNQPGGPHSPKALSDATGLSAEYVKRTLLRLSESNEVKKVGRGKYEPMTPIEGKGHDHLIK